MRNLPAYLSSLCPPTGPAKLLTVVALVILRHGTWQARQTTMGQDWGRDRRTIIRWHQELQRRGLLVVIRRGRKLTNVYRLARWLWERLTGQARPTLPSALQESLFRLGLRIGVPTRTMLARGVAPPILPEGARS